MKSPYILTLALLLAACSGNNDQTAPTDETVVDETAVATDTPPLTGAPAAPTDAAGYVAKAGAGDLWEIESSKALRAKSTNADVKAFAQMMIDQHGKSTAKIKAAATAAKVNAPPPTLDGEQQKRLDEIKAASVTDIDSLYLAHQKTAHDAALALHQGYAANGDNDGLKKAASEIVPVVQAHLTELGKLASKLD